MKLNAVSDLSVSVFKPTSYHSEICAVLSVIDYSMVHFHPDFAYGVFAPYVCYFCG